MASKEGILDEIKRTAKENGGRPLGAHRFQNETGISAYEWGKYWARYGDAVREAGLQPNQRNAAYTNEFLIQKIIGLARKLGAFPTFRELSVEKAKDPEMPDQSAFYRLGHKHEIALKVARYCEDEPRYKDVAALCAPILARITHNEDSGPTSKTVGEVYLFKSGRHYKIGRTNDTVRRGTEIRIQLPERLDLIHSIKTDDPSGIEAYWHKRFESKRVNGEWFDLSPRDVKAFKRWRRIY